MQKKMIPVIVAAVLLISGLLSLLTMHGLQGNARIINNTGVVRGATQRLVKQELNGQENDNLIAKLDRILFELETGRGAYGSIQNKDKEYQELIAEMQTQWSLIKTGIEQVRQGLSGADLYKLSEEYYNLADRTVSAAERYSVRQVQHAAQSIIIMNAIFLLLTVLLTWYKTVQEQRQQAKLEAETADRIRREYLQQMSADLKAPMDEISELMYVSDPQSHELLFINEAGRKTFDITKPDGQKCYQVIQGLDAPCEFCKTSELKSGEFYSWEHTNLKTGRHYLLKDRLIQWEGREARMEIAFDITEAEAEKQALKNRLDAEQMLMECVRTLYQDHDLNRSIPAILEQLGQFLSAERSYLFIMRDEKVSNDYRWCRGEDTAQTNSLQSVIVSEFSRWSSVLEQQKCIVLEDVEVLKESHPEEYELLRTQEIRSLVVTPLEQNGQVIGVLGVDNPPPEQILGFVSLLQTLCYFLLLAYWRSEDERQLSLLSYYDTLTAFYNRNRYMEDSAALSEYNGAVGVVYLDVNGLKDINDQYGHAFGDKMLVGCSRQMREVFLHADCYRIGGDEFVILCPGIDRRSFDANVSELRRRFGIDAPYHVAIGARWDAKIDDVQQFIAEVDLEMYEDKKEFYRTNPVSNRYRHQSDEVLQLSNPEVLREALSQKRFAVYFQPKISASDRSAVGAEALIRYQSRSGSLLLPGNFLPLLEEKNSVSQIDFYVFELVCAQMREWRLQEKQAHPVSVNFSRYSLTQPDFVTRLTDICETYGIEKQYLEIELTETVREPGAIGLKTLIYDLRQAGFLISIDDFGTNHANLALLSEVEFDVLKLDKSLVDDLTNNERTRIMVEATIELCRKMRVQVVAEGVETEEQLTILRKCGVELVQGYLFSKPIPIETYEAKYLK